MNKRFTIRAVAFDFDGVLLESATIKTRAFADMFQDHPEHLPAIVDYHLKNLGMSRYKKFAWIYDKLLKKPLSQDALEKLGARFSELVFEKILKAPYVPGAREALESLRHLGVPVYVVSGTPQEELARIVELRGMQHFFREVWGSPTEKAAALRAIKSTFGFAPDELLFVGDGYFDYQAAATEGIPFFARDSGDGGVDWSLYDVPKAPDLLPIARLASERTVTVASDGEPRSEVVLTLKPASPE